MRHAGVGGTPSAFEVVGQHRFVRRQAKVTQTASTFWLATLYVSTLRSLVEGSACSARRACRQSRPPPFSLSREGQLNQPPQRLRSRWRVRLLGSPRVDFV